VEGDDLLVYCKSEIVTGIFNTRKYENYCWGLIGRCLMNRKVKFGEFFSYEKYFIVLCPLFIQLIHTNYYKIVKQLKNHLKL